MMWLMQQSEIDRVERFLAMGLPATADRAAIKHEASELGMKPGGIASIDIKGPILPGPSAVLDFLGVEYTTYPDITSQVNEAVGRRANRIDLLVNSGGGTVEGIGGAMDAIAASPVKTRAVASGKMASAAYMLASQAREIQAEHELTMVGSIGVATTAVLLEGVKEIANTASPKKRPDMATEEGVAMAREPLDDIYQVLSEKMAASRGVPVETIHNDYGQGAMMTARTALQRGIIDGIISNPPHAATGAVGRQGARSMDIEQFKAEHPDVYRAVIDRGKQQGVQRERERVQAHLVAAEGGDLEAAHAAINDGSDYNALVKAKHDAYARRAAGIVARGEEAPPAIGDGSNLASEASGNKSEAQQKAEFEARNPGWEVS